MKFIFTILAALFTQITLAQSPEPIYESESLKIIPLGEGVFVHLSYLQTDSWGKVGCNGMVFINGEDAVVFDTPTEDTASEELIDWLLNDQKKIIKAVVATHFHEDCLGGIKAFHDRGITTYASEKTIELLQTDGAPVLPQKTFDDKLKLKVGKAKALVYHFGEGHTSDNVVAYIPSSEALFGGCLIKSLNASKGYLGDANVNQWPSTVSNIKIKLPNLKFVIPGHGESGGQDLLDYTIRLFSENQTKDQ